MEIVKGINNVRNSVLELVRSYILPVMVILCLKAFDFNKDGMLI